MPRMPKYLKEKWAFFLDERGGKKYNELWEMRKELQAAFPTIKDSISMRPLPWNDCRNGMTGSKKNASRFCRHWNTFQSWWRSL